MTMQGVAQLPSIPYRIVRLPNGDWHGTATVQTRYGPVTVQAKASPNAEARAIMARLRQGGATAGFLGKLIKGIGKGIGGLAKGVVNVAKKVAKGKILAALRESAKIVTKNPLIRKAVGFATVPFLGPAGAGLVNQGLKAAGAILYRARAKRDPKAKAVIARTVQLARQGNKRALRLAQYFTQSNRILNSWGPAWFRRQASARPRYVRRYIPGRGWMTVRVAGLDGTSDNGQWTAIAGGAEVFVPHAYSGSLLGQLVNQLKFRAPYRGEAEALTLREAYKAGLSSSPR